MYEVQGVATSTLHIQESYRSVLTCTDDPGATPATASPSLGNVVERAIFTPPRVVMADQDSGQPPRDQRPPSYNGPFLFVNKNAKNLKSKQRDEVFAVRSHAMQIARRSRKPAQPKPQALDRNASSDSRVPDSPPVQPSIESPTAGLIPSIQDLLEQQVVGVRQYQQMQSQPGRPSLSRRQSSSHQQQSGSPSSTIPFKASFPPTTTTNLLPAEHAAALSRLNIAASPGASPGNPEILNSNRLPDNFFNSLLQFWRVVYMSNFWPASVYLNSSHRAVQLLDDWLSDTVINNAALLHGLFSATLSYITNYLPSTDSTPILWARAVHHYGKCLEETRIQMAQPGIGTELALSLIHGMTTFGFHCQDWDSCQVHRTASMRLLQGLEGGLESVHPVLKYRLIHFDALIASRLSKRPSIDVDSWAPKPWAEEDSLRPLDGMFASDALGARRTDLTVFLLGDDDPMNDYAEDLLELIGWHREALAASELAFTLTLTSSATPPSSLAYRPRKRCDDADTIYTWLSLRQHALSCLCSHMLLDLLDGDDPELPLPAQIRRVYHKCVLLATSFLFQSIIRCGNDAKYLSYIPYHNLRTQLELLLVLMSQYQKAPTSPTGAGRTGRGPVNPIPTDGLLYLFFAGAIGETADGVSRAAHHVARSGVIHSPPGDEHAGDLISERWFSVHFAMVLQRLNIDHWEHAQQILKRFLYAARVLDQFLCVLVERKLEFLAALVAGVPNGVPARGTGFPGGTAGAHDEMLRATSGQATSQQRHPSQHQQPNLPFPMQPPAFGATLHTASMSEPPSMFGPTPVSLPCMGTGAPAEAGWWQGTGYDLGGEEDFPMDLDVGLSTGPGLGEGFGAEEDLHQE
jgi:hypothetical protein